MKTTLAIVTSINGKITNGTNPDISKWTSKEDKQLLRALIKQHQVILIGRGTYEAYKNKLGLEPNRLRLVLTHEPQKYVKQTVPGQLEFTSEQPKELIKRLESEGYKKLLLLSGEKVNTLFLKQNLVDEIHLTLEPYFFGSGKKISLPFNGSSAWKLKSVKKLNHRGTVHLVYLAKAWPFPEE